MAVAPPLDSTLYAVYDKAGGGNSIFDHGDVRQDRAVSDNTGDSAVGQVTGVAPMASPALTGIPSATSCTATTQLATTAFSSDASNLESGVVVQACLPIATTSSLGIVSTRWGHHFGRGRNHRSPFYGPGISR
jgi:hypothetical protein